LKAIRRYLGLQLIVFPPLAYFCVQRGAMAERKSETQALYAGAGFLSLLLIPVSVAWFAIGSRFVYSIRYNMVNSTISVERPTLLPFVKRHQEFPVSSIEAVTPIKRSKSQSHKLILGEPERTWFILIDEPACKPAIEAVIPPKIKLREE